MGKDRLPETAQLCARYGYQPSGVNIPTLCLAYTPLLPPWRPTASGLEAHKTASDQLEVCPQNSSLLEPGKQALLDSYLPTLALISGAPAAVLGPVLTRRAVPLTALARLWLFLQPFLLFAAVF